MDKHPFGLNGRPCSIADVADGESLCALNPIDVSACLQRLSERRAPEESQGEGAGVGRLIWFVGGSAEDVIKKHGADSAMHMTRGSFVRRTEDELRRNRAVTVVVQD